MGFRRRTRDQLDHLRAELEVLRASDEQRRAANAAAAAATSTSEPADAGEPVESLPPPEPGSSLDDVRAALAALSDRVEGLDVRQATDHKGVQTRLEEVSVLLTNQLTELSSELEDGYAQLRSDLAAQSLRVDQLAEEASQASTSSAAPADDERVTALLEELRTNQIRIANDLARHEISVRQDVATLAELVKRPTR